MTITLFNRYFREIMDAVPDPIVVYDTEGLVQYLNRQFIEIFGWTLDELVGQRLDFVPPHEIETTRDAVIKTINGEDVLFQTQRYNKAGDILDIQVSASLYDDASGKRGGMIVAFSNITELKKAEAELVQAREEADQANRSKSDFLAKMSHEIRTPMNAIIGLTDLTLKTDLTQKQRDYLTKVSWSAHTLLEIINDILDFSKIEAGKMTLEEVDFSLDDVLSHIADLVTIKAGEKNIEINFQQDKKIPLGLKGDSLRLGQVLLNLMNNAIKFTEKGEIAVTTHLEEEEENQVKLLFMVQDTGIGLSHDQIDHLFKSFSQADESTTRKFGGTGLGLAICKKLVTMMGGKIWVKSIPGVGSQFFFNAYFRRQSTQISPPSFPQMDELRGLNVLVVDDSKIARQIFKDYLTVMPFSVTLAASGEEGIKKVIEADSKKPYELILMDWKMPGMNGIETAKTIFADKRLKHRPKIIMVSAFAREDIKFQVKKYKLDGFLLKPINMPILLETIAMVCGKKVTSQRESVSVLPEKNRRLESIRGAHILLVEDNAINQLVAFELINREGLSVMTVNNGEEAVNAVKEHTFDLVFMDIQMPVMDGYTATQKIRNLPQGRNLPIVAMTAHAMTGDYKKSLDSGMDGHITKPIDTDELASILLQWISPRTIIEEMPIKKSDSQGKKSKPGLLPETLPGFDIQDGLTRTDNDPDLYLRLLTIFKQDYKDWFAKIQTALLSGDIDQARGLVHNIKGVSGNIGASHLFETAGELEAALESGEDNLYQDLCKSFENELNLVLSSLKKIKPKMKEPIAPVRDQDSENGSQELLENIRKYKPFIKAGKPKKCKDFMDQIKKIQFPRALANEIDHLESQISRYNFKGSLKTLEMIEYKLKNTVDL